MSRHDDVNAVDVLEELNKARLKFPAMSSAHEGWAILREEVDELWDVVKEQHNAPGRKERMRKEAVQVAAMALRFIHDVCDR